MFQIFGAMAEFERSLIQERVRAGLQQREAQGKDSGEAASNRQWRRDGTPASKRREFLTDCESGRSVAGHGSHTSAGD
jgi:DNA invertase Pin-like site-specific DNA recombinase